MKDFSFWEEYEGTSEGSGRSEKIWLQNPDTGQIGLFKFKKDVGTTDHVSECIAYDLASLLGIPCAKFELGTYFGREGSFSYNIIQKRDENLIEGIYFISLLYPAYDAEQFIDMKTQHRYSIEMIVRSIEKFVPIDDFLHMMVFDYLIGNSDRHQSNWAIIYNGREMRWSPLYDNSSSLCAYIAEEQIDSYLGNDIKRWQSLVDTKSKSLIRCTESEAKRPTHLMVLNYIKNNFFKATHQFVRNTVSLLTEPKIIDILNKYSETKLSEKKKMLIRKYLLWKVQMLNEVYFGKEESDVD